MNELPNYTQETEKHKSNALNEELKKLEKKFILESLKEQNYRRKQEHDEWIENRIEQYNHDKEANEFAPFN